MDEIKKLILHIEKSIELAEKKTSKLDGYVEFSNISMTGEKTRHFYNNLLSYEDSRYLEIGTTDNLIDKIFLPGNVIDKTWWNGIGIFLLKKYEKI